MPAHYGHVLLELIQRVLEHLLILCERPLELSIVLSDVLSVLVQGGILGGEGAHLVVRVPVLRIKLSQLLLYLRGLRRLRLIETIVEVGLIRKAAGRKLPLQAKLHAFE